MQINGTEVKYKPSRPIKTIGEVVTLSDELSFGKILQAATNDKLMDALKSNFAKFCEMAIESPADIDIESLTADEVMDLTSGFFMPRSLLAIKS